MMIAKLTNDGQMIRCPQSGQDGRGLLHTDLPLYYTHHLDDAAQDGYYPVQYTDKPDGDYLPSWELIGGEITQVWTPYTPEPEPEDPVTERLDEQDAKIDYLAMMAGIDFDEEAATNEQV